MWYTTSVYKLIVRINFSRKIKWNKIYEYVTWKKKEKPRARRTWRKYQKWCWITSFIGKYDLTCNIFIFIFILLEKIVRILDRQCKYFVTIFYIETILYFYQSSIYERETLTNFCNSMCHFWPLIVPRYAWNSLFATCCFANG